MAFVCWVSVGLQCTWEDGDIFNIKACDLYYNHWLWRKETLINNWFMIIVLTASIITGTLLNPELCHENNLAFKVNL
jgi:hypothetical protein